MRPPLDRKLVAVDVGCRWGFAERFTQSAAFRVIGFEPDEAECARLRERHAADDVTLVPLALAGEAGPRTLYLTAEPACSSLLEPDPALTHAYPALGCARLVGQRTVDTVTLDAWCHDHDRGPIDHIKLDTQGTELEILRGGVRALAAVRSVEVEVELNPIYRGQPLFADVDAHLRARGLVLWKLTNAVHYAPGPASERRLADDLLCFDERQAIAVPRFGGQLFWANAHYVSQDVLRPEQATVAQLERDRVLFEALGMPDVIDVRTAMAR